MKDIEFLPLPQWTTRVDGVPLYSTQTLREYAAACMTAECTRLLVTIGNLSDALESVKYSAVSLADAQVIALEALKA